MKTPDFREIDGGPPFYMLVGFIGVFVLAGLGAAFYMEHNGHWVTGMSNQIIWGTPHVFAVFLIVAASGALNVASISSVFNKSAYKPLARLSGLLAIALLVGGLAVLVLDLGRPDRFLYVLFRPQWKSWLSRGSYIITVYGGLLTAWLAASFTGYTEILKFIEPFGVVFGLLSAIYTAFLFAQAKGRDFWQSPMLGLHMIIHSLMAGFAVFLISTFYLKLNIGLMSVLVFLTVVTVLFHLITLAIELTTTHSTDDAHKVVKMITSGQYSSAFWFGMVVVGNLIPVIILMTVSNYIAIAATGILILIGLAFAQHIWVKAPQQIPLS